MKFYRPWIFLKFIFPEAVFRGDIQGRKLYLTIDDGPHPDSTEKLLKLLDKYDIKGVFFCLGKAAQEYPLLFSKILTSGHLIGNHGYYHINGWKTNTNDYTENIARASVFINTRLFRPPYGKIRIKQYARAIRNYKVVFWDLMSYDFDTKINKGRVLKKLFQKMRCGSVIVFHDSPQALSSNLLEDFIRGAMVRGYSFELPVL